MKKTNMIFGFIWIFVAVVLCWIFISKMRGNSSIKIYSLNGKLISSDEDSLFLYKEEVFNGSEVSFIEVDVASEAVSYEAVKGNELTVELRGKGWDEKIEPKITVKGNKLTVKRPNLRGIKVTGNSRKVVVKVPETTMKNGLKIESNSASGSLHMNGLEADKINVNQASGSTHIYDCSVDKVEIDSASGSIHVGNSEVSKIEVSSASGSTHLEGSFEQFNIESASGSVHIASDVEIKKDSSVEVVSGSVNIKLPPESMFNVNYDTLSGSFKNDFNPSAKGKHGTLTVDGNHPTLSIETVSGSIKIQR